MKQYAIVGFGAAGYSAARAIRQLDTEGQIDVFDFSPLVPSNPMLTTYFAGDKLDAAGLQPFGSFEVLAKELRLRPHLGAVKGVDGWGRMVELESGQRFPFDKLLIATGAEPLIPPLSGLPDGRVFVMRTPEDARLLRQRLSANPPKRAVVVGASMVGIKVAEILHKAGISTTVADLASYLFPLAAFEDVAREMERRLTAQGLEFKWNAAVSGITQKGVAFSDGTELPADIVCLCLGTRPRIGLITGEKRHSVKTRRAILVDKRMETSHKNIYAAGDCCEGLNVQSGDNAIIGLWANARNQGETAGRNMAGQTAEYAGNVLHNITHFMDMDFVGIGDNRLEGQQFTFGSLEGGGYVKALVKDGKPVCVNLLDKPLLGGMLKSHLMKCSVSAEAQKLTPIQAGAFIKQGLSRDFLNMIGGL